MPNYQQIISFLRRLKYYISWSLEYYSPATLFTYFVKNNYPLFILRIGLFLGVNIQREAVRHATDNEQYQVLELFAQYKHRINDYVVDYLINLLSYNINNALNSDANACDTYLVKAEILLKLGAPPLVWEIVKPAAKNISKILTLFKAYGADLNEIIIRKSPLMDAIEKNMTDPAIALINAGANVNQTTDDGYSVMWWAKYHGNISVINALKNKGVATDAKVKYKGEYRDFLNLCSLFSYSALELLATFTPGSTIAYIENEEELLHRFPDLIRDNIARKLFMQMIVSKINDLYMDVTDDVITKLYDLTMKTIKLDTDDQVYRIKRAVQTAIKTADLKVTVKLSKVLFANIMRHFDGLTPNWNSWARLYKCEFLPAFKAARDEQDAEEQTAARYHPVILNRPRRALVYDNAKKLAEEHSCDVQVLTQQTFRKLLGF